MDLGLKDRLAVVTGASKGIGLAITRALVAEGARVVAGSRHSSPELGDLVDGGRVYAVAVDLSTTEGPQQLINAAREQGRPRPTSLGRRAIAPPPGTTPAPTSNWPNRLFSREANRRSHASTNSLPAPRARPRIDAMLTTGARERRTSRSLRRR